MNYSSLLPCYQRSTFRVNWQLNKLRLKPSEKSLELSAHCLGPLCMSQIHSLKANSFNLQFSYKKTRDLWDSPFMCSSVWFYPKASQWLYSYKFSRMSRLSFRSPKSWEKPGPRSSPVYLKELYLFWPGRHFSTFLQGQLSSTLDFSCIFEYLLGFPGGSGGKESACNAGDPGLIPGWKRSPGEGHGNPLQYSCLEKPMDREAWQAIVHRVTKSWTTQPLNHHCFQQPGDSPLSCGASPCTTAVSSLQDWQCQPWGTRGPW